MIHRWKRALNTVDSFPNIKLSESKKSRVILFTREVVDEPIYPKLEKFIEGHREQDLTVGVKD